jgi:hypothetical protein
VGAVYALPIHYRGHSGIGREKFMYPVIEVPPEASELTETLGTKPKFWFTDPSMGLSLYKEGRPGSGEHWSEKIAAELATLIGVPHAVYELAHWKERHGVVSPTFVPHGGRLVLGNELLARFVRDYASNAQRYKLRQYTVRSAMAVLGLVPVAPPLCGLPENLPNEAPEIFVGYLMLDALIGNQDRHHENWGLVVRAQEGQSRVSLAPSFDHASSLGRNETDDERIRRLKTKDQGSSVAYYCTRAMSPFYLAASDVRRLSTLDAFHEAARVKPNAASRWLTMLSAIRDSDIEAILGSVPSTEMSDPAKEFAFEMVRVNRRRLLESPLPK